jgi:HlyD family secretion protein
MINQQDLKKLSIPAEAKQRSQRPLWVIFLGIAAVVGIAVFYWWPRATDSVRVLGGKTSGNAAEKKLAASSAPATLTNSVTRAIATKSERVSGTVLTVSGYIINRERIELSPRFLGVVKWIGVKKGDGVTNGQVVVLLDDIEYRARLKEIEGREANAKVAIEKAQLSYDRVIKLAKQNIQSRELEDEARLQLESAKASLKEIEGNKAIVQTYMDWCIVRSPINGVVLDKLVDPNELVMPQSFGGGNGPSTALIALADPQDLQVEIDINESDLSKIFLNQKCKVSPEAYLEKSYDGYVAEIAPEATRAKGTLQIKVQILNPDKFLTPELSAKVDFLSRKP